MNFANVSPSGCATFELYLVVLHLLNQFFQIHARCGVSPEPGADGSHDVFQRLEYGPLPSAQPPDPNHEPTEGAVPSEQRRNSDSDHKADTKWRDFPRARWLVLLYVVFLVWRVTSLTLYGVYSTECFFRAKLATLRCENFTLFPSPTTVEIAWQLSSSLNCLVALLVLVKLPPAHTPGLRAILRRLVQMARFWSLLGQLTV